MVHPAAGPVTLSSAPPPASLTKALEALDPAAPLDKRLDALEDVARWVLEIEAIKRLRAPAPLQLARLKQLMRVLSAAPQARARFVATVAGILRDTSAVALFSEAGMPNDRGITSETVDRIASRLLPRPPDDEDLERFVSRVFRSPRDCAWIEAAPIELFVELGALFASTGEDIWAPVRAAMEDAIALLCTRISALGLNPELRQRSEAMNVRDSPFFRLPHAPLEQLPMLVVECRGQVSFIRRRLETTGVSVDVVYCLDAIRRMLLRVERMVPLVAGGRDPRDQAERVRGLLGVLTAGRIADDSFRQLIGGNLGLLARKVIERVGHSGEQYVTSTRREYARLLASAAGGGAVMAGTVVFRFFARLQHFAPFMEGLTSWANYAASFLLLQLLGLTLATKQPAATAAALAATIRETKGEHELDDLVVLIARISRSQFAAALGNVLAVIPVAILIDVAWVSALGHHILDPAAAAATIASFDPLHSGTIFFAALTGVLLWLSSLAAGWIENWITYRRLPEALRHHRMGSLVGRKRMDWLATFLERHAAGIGGAIALGFFLAMTPVVGTFTGLPLDIRHITLSTGQLAFAGCTLGIGAVTVSAMIGIAIIGILNFGASFALALAVALRAREVTSKERIGLAVGVWRRFLRHPFRFFFPPKDEAVVPLHAYPPGTPGSGEGAVGASQPMPVADSSSGSASPK